MLRVDDQDKARLIDPMFSAGWRFWLALGILGAVAVWGGLMYYRQVNLGLITTGMDRPAYWGMYIVNFIFLIGISMAGTLVTAALYLTGANWRRPITRIAEVTTVFGLMIAGLQIVIDMGRPERLLSMLIYGRLESPMVWDMASLTLYLLSSMFALYISLLPDLGILRDNLSFRAPGWRKLLYTAGALGWRGNREQWRRLERTIRLVSVLIIPIGVSLHTVTSWILSTTMQPGWHSTILGPYFVVGAIFSGIALVFILLTVVRHFTGAKFYVGTEHYAQLGWLFITMSIVWFYFTYTEHLVVAAGHEESEFAVLASKMWGPDAPAFWGMVFLMAFAVFVLAGPHLVPARWIQAPVFRPRTALASASAACLAVGLLVFPQVQPVTAQLAGPNLHSLLIWMAVGLAALALVSALPWLKQHPVAATLAASVAVVAGMWLERWNIIVPSVTHARMVPWSPYVPTTTEWSLTAASIALFALLLMIFFKLFPAVSLWEVAEGRVIDEAQAKVEIPLPRESTGPYGHAWSTPRRS